MQNNIIFVQLLLISLHHLKLTSDTIGTPKPHHIRRVQKSLFNFLFDFFVISFVVLEVVFVNNSRVLINCAVHRLTIGRGGAPLGEAKSERENEPFEVDCRYTNDELAP